jgi:D-sedoheptulose 7-phosphate isomerase
MKNFTNLYLDKFSELVKNLDTIKLDKIVNLLANLRKKNGRLFIIGIGGSAANSSHAVNDFRKLCNIEAITPIDNFSEFSATTNDKGFEFSFIESLKISKLNKKDILLILSVGGGNLKRNSSIGIIKSIKLAKSRKCKIISFTGKSDGYAGKNSDINIALPNDIKKFLTPYAESMQTVIWHFLVSNPKLQKKNTFW